MDYRSSHQKRVDEFMHLAQQRVPEEPTEPSEEVRLLRARLILEEALETILEGLGVDIALYCPNLGWIVMNGPQAYQPKFSINWKFNMEKTIDGCCDLKVVTTGTLSACGVPDEPFQEEVDKNNLAKFGVGHSYRDDGKLVKPLNHQPPNIKKVLAALALKTELDKNETL